MNRIIAVIVNNRAGVLNRITGLFLRRDFNIQSISVGTTETPGLSRMTVVLNVPDERMVEQVLKQLHKQIDVLKVTDITDTPIVARELVLIKVNSPLQSRSEVTALIEPFRATIIDVSRETVTILAVGHPEKVEALMSLLQPFGIKELVRTGVTAFARANDGASDSSRTSKAHVLTL